MAQWKPKPIPKLRDKVEVISTKDGITTKEALKGLKEEQKLIEENRNLTFSERLNEIGFDPIAELYLIYEDGGLSRIAKVKLLLQLLPYLYPKLKSSDLNISNLTGTPLSIQNNIIYVEEKIDDIEEISQENIKVEKIDPK